MSGQQYISFFTRLHYVCCAENDDDNRGSRSVSWIISNM